MLKCSVSDYWYSLTSQKLEETNYCESNGAGQKSKGQKYKCQKWKARANIFKNLWNPFGLRSFYGTLCDIQEEELFQNAEEQAGIAES